MSAASSFTGELPPNMPPREFADANLPIICLYFAVTPVESVAF
jgi:hypothetical protein